MKKYHYNVDVCKIYLKYLYVIDDTKKYQNPKLKFLANLKKELEKENLLEYHPNVKKYLANKKKIVLNYPKLDLYEEKALSVTANDDISYHPIKVVEYKTMEDEVNGVALEICLL